MTIRFPRHSHTAAALLAAFALAWAAAPAPEKAVDDAARPAPLAAKNLLLAGTVPPGAQRRVAVGEYGHVLLSDDAGKTWRQARSVPTVTTLTSVHFIDAQRGWAAGHGGVVLGTADGGETWQRLAGALDGKEVILSIWFADANEGLAVGAFGYAARSHDGGRTWQAQTLAEGEDGERHLNQVFATAADAGGTRTLWVAAEGGLLFRSADGGARWEPVKTPYKGSLWGGTALADGTLLAWGMRGTVLRSDDGGKTFAVVPTGSEQSIGGGVQLADGRVVLAALGGTVLASTDAGRSFTATVRDDRAGFAAVLPGTGSEVLLLGQAGVIAHALATTVSTGK